MESLTALLGSLGGTALRWSALAFLLVNGVAAAVFFVTRDRSLVNRWTSRLVATNLFLLGVGVGVPAVAFCLRTVVNAVTLSQATEVRLQDK
ncbi:MAG: hypothetical protein SFV24_10825 [Gemmatimonadales bacterium]|nr:hypothetical protein [Gemmatimonadales bacterium]